MDLTNNTDTVHQDCYWFLIRTIKLFKPITTIPVQQIVSSVNANQGN